MSGTVSAGDNDSDRGEDWTLVDQNGKTIVAMTGGATKQWSRFKGRGFDLRYKI